MKKYLAAIYFLFTIFGGKLSAQSKFYKRYANHVGNCTSNIVKKTQDGGFIVDAALGGPQWGEQLIKYDACGNIQWYKDYPFFRASDFIVCSNGNMILFSYYPSLKLLRLDSGGNIIWCNSYTTGASDYWGLSTGEFSNGDLFFSGSAHFPNNPPGWHDHYYNFIIKTDSNGNLKWNKYYGDIACWGMAIACRDGGVLSRAAEVSFKTDSLGNLEWSKYYSGTSYSYKPIEVNDGFVFARYGEIAGRDTGFIYKTDKIGNLLWVGERFLTNSIMQISRLSNGNYLMIGSLKRDSLHYTFLPTVIETDSMGRFLHQRTYNPQVSTANSYHGKSFCLLKDSSMVFVGEEDAEGYNTETTWLYTAKTNKKYEMGCGDSILFQHFPPPSVVPDTFTMAAVNLVFNKNIDVVNINTDDPGEQTVCSGYDTSNFQLPLFEFLCINGTLVLNGPNGNYEYTWSTGSTNQSVTVSNPGIYGLRIVDPCIHDTINTFTFVLPISCSSGIESNTIENIIIYPNPTNGLIYINMNTKQAENLKIKIRNTLGQLIYFSEILRTQDQFYKAIDITGQPKGIYFVEIVVEGKRTVKKIIFE